MAIRAKDLAGLSPTCPLTGAFDFSALKISRMLSEFHVCRGTYHDFYVFVPDADVSKRCVQGYESALRRALHG